MDRTGESPGRLSRRQFARRTAELGLCVAGLAVLSGCSRLSAPIAPARGGDPTLETTRLRLDPLSICGAPQVVAEELLRAEGFTDIQYRVVPNLSAREALVAGELDLDVQFAAPSIIRVDAGDPIVFLAGVHVGCFEVFGSDQVRTLSDLKGRSAAVGAVGAVGHVLLSTMLAYVGLDPQRDVRLIHAPSAEGIQLFTAGQTDAIIGTPPLPQRIREAGYGRVIMNSSLDRPWSQYFCCMLAGNRQFVQQNPEATRRAMRALLKATDICAADPAGAARIVVDKGYPARYEHVLQALQSIPYSKWREYDPEDTIRFYSLRLHDVGMIKSSPNTILRDGTDWRYLNELKRELKT
ncbi:MAG TPA: ABC transporter substrate-binding protein [Chloroflexota bacterium]|nr:ABC transporter substrate-binding protein [Chloroflexota bacterium]